MTPLSVYEQRREGADRAREAAKRAAQNTSRRVQNIAAHIAELRYLAAVYLDGAERAAGLINVDAFEALLLPALAAYEAAERETV